MDILFRCKLVVDVSTALDLMGFMGEMFWFRAVVPRTGRPERLRLRFELRGCWFIFPHGTTVVPPDDTCCIPLLDLLIPMVRSVLEPTVTVTSPLSGAINPAEVAPTPVEWNPPAPIPTVPGLAALMLLALI